MFKQMIEMIHQDFTLHESMKDSQMQKDSNDVKAVILSTLLLFQCNKEKRELSIVDFYTIIETLFQKEDFDLVLKAINYMTANRVGLLDIHFVYFYKDGDEEKRYPMTAEQYRNLKMKGVVPFTEEDLKIVGEFNDKRTGFYCTLKKDFIKKDEEK